MDSSYTHQYGLPKYIAISDYLFHRLNQLNIHTIFGLSGEFSMPLLDKLYDIPNLRWAGNSNELNAAYAADGYSRLKGLGCLITTFGVGELSAINGVAGSYAEHVGILHIVGMPPTSAQTKQLLLHHTLGNGDFTVFHRIASDVACYTTLIVDSDLCADEVDKCIQKAWIEQRPVYMGIPVNQVNLPLESERLNTPLDLQLHKNDPDVEKEVITRILSFIYKSKNPAIIVDACTSRQNLIEEAKELCSRLKFPIFVTPMGKGTVNETDPHFGGVFTGSISAPEVREVVDFADFIIVIGCMLSEFSTSTFHFQYKTKNCALLYSTSVKLKNATYPDLSVKILLQKLLATLDESKLSYRPDEQPSMMVPRPYPAGNVLLRQEWVWNEISRWFQPGDIIITETGASAFGVNQTRFPVNTLGISQALWGSVGYTMGACLGAEFAVQEINKDKFPATKHRVILFMGDGAFQLTVQELSTIVKWGLTPYIFVMNNQGYSVDRFLHHRADAGYYDIQPWNYLGLLRVFGCTNYETKKIITVGEFRSMINDANFAVNDKIRMIEIMLPPRDVPQALLDRWVVEKEQSKQMQEENENSSAVDTPTPEFQPLLKKIKLDTDMISPTYYQGP
ncbi:hypothetical protein SUVZ_04G1650 [Saccharomyces uvarum]|uniref:branched-chain-2-oxoacid decarboxylase n=1 Tax=Saccharomyces uvarum TaxID=230603 RepID=A0ABN8WUL0_SACUV|nr:hypothetical protein SUVZ_04G1650 [Saccharomyces uvarum]